VGAVVDQDRAPDADRPDPLGSEAAGPRGPEGLDGGDQAPGGAGHHDPGAVGRGGLPVGGQEGIAAAMECNQGGEAWG
jgi:hypothetical protein